MKITEEMRAELLASNASRDVVEAVLARLDHLERFAQKAAKASRPPMASVGGRSAGKAFEALIREAERTGDWSALVTARTRE